MTQQKLFQAVAFFDFSVGEARFAFVAHAGFGQIQIIVQILQFLAQRGKSARASDGLSEPRFFPPF